MNPDTNEFYSPPRNEPVLLQVAFGGRGDPREQKSSTNPGALSGWYQVACSATYYPDTESALRAARQSPEGPVIVYEDTRQPWAVTNIEAIPLTNDDYSRFLKTQGSSREIEGERAHLVQRAVNGLLLELPATKPDGTIPVSCMVSGKRRSEEVMISPRELIAALILRRANIEIRIRKTPDWKEYVFLSRKDN